MVKLTMEPVTRIEGHAKITVHLDEAGNVEYSFRIRYSGSN